MNRFVPWFLTLAACPVPAPPEDWEDWYAEAQPYDVAEPVAFTDENYDFPANDADGIRAQVGSVLTGTQSGVAWGQGEIPDGVTCEGWAENAALPAEIEGVVTLLPRFYFKSSGCGRDDEKYYGSWFIQDRTGGIFVLGDSKVAHFDMGARVRINVRAIRRNFGLNMVYAHDVLEVDPEPEPIYAEPVTGKLGEADIAKVKRVTGVVVDEPDTFGLFHVARDGDSSCTATNLGNCIGVQLDSDLNKRGVRYEPGAHISVAGPVLYSFSAYSIIVMRVGQVEVL